MKLLVLTLLLLTASCATTRNMPREEYLRTTTRTYDGLSKDEILNKIEKIFLLSDKDDYSFAHTPNGMQANRRWLVYLILAASSGTDSWAINIEEKDGKSLVSVNVSTSSGTVAASPNGGSGANTLTTPSNSYILQGNSIYYLFYSRLDYLLGKSDKWLTCSEFEKFISEENKTSEVYWGLTDPLCNSFNIDDLKPERRIAQDKTKKLSRDYSSTKYEEE